MAFNNFNSTNVEFPAAVQSHPEQAHALPMASQGKSISRSNLNPDAPLFYPSTRPIYTFPPQYRPFNPHVQSHMPMRLAGPPLPTPVIPFPDYGSLSIQIAMQIHYYFSDENLKDDYYLKECMDPNGWVPIGIIAEFRKMKMLTDNQLLMLNSLIGSKEVEVQGQNVRSRNWAAWVKED